MTGHFPTALRQLARRPSLLRKSGGSRASTEAPRRRAGPLSPSTRSQPRQRDDAWFVSGTAPRFSRAPSGQSILIATPWIIHGGVDRSVVDLAKGLRAVEPSLRIYVATTESARMTWAQEVLSAVDGVFPVGEYGATDPTAAFCELGERLGIRSLLIANSALACAALPKLRRSLPGLRVIVQAHSFDELPGSTVPLGRAAAAASEYNNLIDAYAAISDRAGRTLCEKLYVSPSKVHTIHLGIDRERFARGSGKRFGGGPLRVLWLGRLSEEKDPLMALEVAAQFKQKHGPQALTIKIVGGGPLAPQLELRRRALGLEDVVELVAPVEDPVPFFANADCLLLTSRYEGIPVVLYEAMAAALPVVAPTANTAIQEVLSERESLLVDPRTPKAFVFALERLLNEAELGPKLSSSIAKLASRYSRERFARETLDLLLPSPEHTLKAS